MTSLAYEASKDPRILEDLTPEELLRLEYDFSFWGRKDQLEPEEFKIGDYLSWMILAGRGWGKSRVGSETTNLRVREGRISRIGLIAPTAADARDVMVEGVSGIIVTSPPWFRAEYHPSRREIIWPNGAKATIFSAEDPDQIRGHQHDWLWMDELAAWSHLTMQDAFDQAMFTLRQGSAQYMITTTPRPIKIIRDLLKRSSVYVTRGSSYDNLQNLSPTFREQIISQYEGTRLGRQELNAEILDDTPGALWTASNLDEFRIKKEDCPPLKRIAIGVDPAGSREGHEIGICVGGIAYDSQGYLLADLSMHGSPDEWANRVIEAYDEYQADSIVIENNFGGQMVSSVIRNIRPEAAIKEVRASRGKAVRAEPISMLYERGLIHHAGGFPILEDQLTTWLAEEGSNDRLDALVWLFTELMSSQMRGKVWFA